jgi:hypothetical protein
MAEPNINYRCSFIPHLQSRIRFLRIPQGARQGGMDMLAGKIPPVGWPPIKG